MTSVLAIDALLMAVWRRKPKQEVMIHSDQGSQGEFNRSSQHWIDGQILDTHSVLRQVFSSRVFFGASCSARGLLLGSLEHSNETGRCLSGSIAVEGRSYFRSWLSDRLVIRESH
jgi:hypothetical protein